MRYRVDVEAGVIDLSGAGESISICLHGEVVASGVVGGDVNSHRGSTELTSGSWLDREGDRRI